MTQHMVLLVAMSIACGGKSPPAPEPEAAAAVAPVEPDAHKPEAEMTELTGTAMNAKMGAVLVNKAGDHWIDLDAWPDEVLNKTVKVTGTWVTRGDVPVVAEYVPGQPVSAGVPVPAGADIEAASKRQVLANVQWELVP